MDRSISTTLLLSACAIVAAFCSPTSADGAGVPTGTWGGQHIVLVVTSAGATVEFDCAHGTVDAPLVLDNDGRFTLTGTFTPERPGPARDDQSAESKPARYRGSMKDSTLTLTIELVEGNESIGVFTVKRDAPARLFKCR